MELSKINSLRLKRQHLDQPCNQEAYESLFRDLSPCLPVYWTMPGNPPSMDYRAEFNDFTYNSQIRAKRTIVKGRFCGGNIGYVYADELDLYGAAFRKSRDNLTFDEEMIIRLFEQEGPMNIGLIKEITEMKAKEITPILHKLQTKFLVYEDQLDSEWDRGWFLFESEFDEVDVMSKSKLQAHQEIFLRFAYRFVWFDEKMLKAYYRLTLKEIKSAINELLATEKLVIQKVNGKQAYMLPEDVERIEHVKNSDAIFIHILNRNDPMVKANEHWLKSVYKDKQWANIYYILVNGQFVGSVLGKFRNGPFDFKDLVINEDLVDPKLIKDQVLSVLKDRLDEGETMPSLYMGQEI